jgi:flagellin
MFKDRSFTMAQVISTNIASLNAQRNLNTSQTALQTSLQRLASGMRINTAKDDAAGLSISERMSAQIMGMDTAVRNANDGISLAQTAEGDLAQITSNLQRIRELSVQAANATNSKGDRATIQAEVAQLKSEIDRVAQASSFNGVKLLDGSFTDQSFQVGADNNANNSVTISQVVNARASVLGVMYAYAGGANVSSTGSLNTDLKINGTAIRATTSADDTTTTTTLGSAYGKIKAINEASGTTGVTATATTTVVGGAAVVGTTAAAGALTINGTATGSIAVGASIGESVTNAVTAINLISTTTGVSATANTTTGVMTLVAADGRNVTIAGAAGVLVNTGLTAAAAVTSTGKITLTSKAQFTIAENGGTAGVGATNTGLTMGVAVGAASAAVSTIDVTDSNGANAKAAIDIIDNALNTINSARASLGAIQNRFSSVVVSLQTSSENLSASRSRIRDTDFAAEVAGLTRNQILQQAGTAMLAQANSLPQNVLSLLK